MKCDKKQKQQQKKKKQRKEKKRRKERTVFGGETHYSGFSPVCILLSRCFLVYIFFIIHLPIHIGQAVDFPFDHFAYTHSPKLCMRMLYSILFAVKFHCSFAAPGSSVG